MRLTGFGEAALPSGRVHLWQMEPTAWEAARLHPAPPAANQLARVSRAGARREQGSASAEWGSVAFEVAGRVDFEVLTGALEQLVRRHETLLTGFKGRHRLAVPPGRVSLRHIVFDGVNDPEQVLARHFDQATDPLGWPAYAFAAVEGPGRTVVLLAFDQVHADLYSYAIAADDMCRLLAGERPGEPGSHVRFSAQEAQAELDPLVVAAWRQFLQQGDGTLPGTGLELGVPVGEEVPLTEVEWRLLGPVESDRLEGWCAESGMSLFVALLTGFAVASTELTGEAVYRALLMLPTRQAGDEGAMGWYSTAAPLSIVVDGGLDQVLVSALRAARRAQHFAATPLDRVLAEIPGARGEKVSWLSYVDLRGLRPVRFLAGPRPGNEADFWFGRSEEGTFLYCRYPDTEIGYEVVRHLADLTAKTLAQLAPARL